MIVYENSTQKGLLITILFDQAQMCVDLVSLTVEFLTTDLKFISVIFFGVFLVCYVCQNIPSEVQKDGLKVQHNPAVGQTSWSRMFMVRFDIYNKRHFRENINN